MFFFPFTSIHRGITNIDVIFKKLHLQLMYRYVQNIQIQSITTGMRTNNHSILHIKNHKDGVTKLH